MRHRLTLEEEAYEYFSHNKTETEVGFALLTSEQLKQAIDGDEITGQLDVISVIDNPTNFKMEIIGRPFED